jgi:hypothetical protein
MLIFTGATEIDSMILFWTPLYYSCSSQICFAMPEGWERVISFKWNVRYIQMIASRKKVMKFQMKSMLMT